MKAGKWRPRDTKQFSRYQTAKKWLLVGNFLKQVTPESISGVDSINSLTRYSPRFLSEESDRDQQVLIDEERAAGGGPAWAGEVPGGQGASGLPSLPAPELCWVGPLLCKDFQSKEQCVLFLNGGSGFIRLCYLPSLPQLASGLIFRASFPLFTVFLLFELS